MVCAPMRSTLLAALLFSLAAPLATGCAADAQSQEAESDESDVVSVSDAQIKRELSAAIAGLETGGGDGDPDPYKLVDFKARKSATILDDTLVLKRILPKMKDVYRSDDPIPGLESGGTMTELWADLTAAPNASDYDGDPEGLAAAKAQAAKWASAKSVIEGRLTNLRYLHVGYRGYEGGSLETGAVALTIVGQTP